MQYIAGYDFVHNFLKTFYSSLVNRLPLLLNVELISKLDCLQVPFTLKKFKLKL